ncbi:MAG: tetratricopeptide repeat protein [Anaerolineae bacterium]
MNESLIFAEWLKRRRKSLDLTREKLAFQVGCSFETIKKIESGDLKPSAQLAELIATKLQVPATRHAAFVQFARSNTPMAAQAFIELPLAGLSAAPAPLTPLPGPVTSFLGRDREVRAALKMLHRPNIRLLTLSGPPGAGKTRLSLALAYTLQGEFPDGVFFVPLALVGDPALVLPTIAQALDIQEVAGRPLLAAMQTFLRDQRLLLVLDNFEQVVAAGPVVTDLLTAAPQVKVIVSSREILHVYGEHEFPVPPLELPDVRHLPPPVALSRYSAIALFVARAQAVKPGFELTETNAQAVAQICALLDGLPLAIEMAAAQMRRQSPPRVIAQLKERLVALGGGMRDLSPRQQTLRGAIDWSYNLLDDAERRLLGDMSVFAGSFTFAAVLACSQDDSPEYIENLETILGNLIDKNLAVLRADDAGVPRYTMFEMIRDYARDKLSVQGQLEAARTRHAAYYLLLAEQAAQELTGADGSNYLDRLDREHDNLRAALRWSLEQRSVEHALGLCIALGSFWVTRGHWTEGAQWTDQALALLPVAHTRTEQRLRAGVLYAAAQLVSRSENDAAPRAMYEESLHLRRLLGDRRAIAESLTSMSVFCYMHGEHDAARTYAREGLELCRALGDRPGCARLLNILGRLELARVEHAAARVYLLESITISRELQDKNSLAVALYHLGGAAGTEGRYADARRDLLKALELQRAFGDAYAVPAVLNSLGMCAAHQGDFAPAREWLAESLALERGLGDRYGEAFTHLGLGLVEFFQGNLAEAHGAMEESIRLAGHVGVKTGAARWARTYLGQIALAEGDYQTARRHGAETLAEWRALNDKECIADSAWTLGFVALSEADYAGARQFLDLALENRRVVNHQPHLVDTHLGLGYLSFKQGAMDEAAGHYAKGLRIAAGIGDGRRVALVLLALAGVALARDDAERAARLMGASAALGSDSDLLSLPHMMSQDYAAFESQARAVLAPDPFERAWKEGVDNSLSWNIIE